MATNDAQSAKAAKDARIAHGTKGENTENSKPKHQYKYNWGRLKLVIIVAAVIYTLFSIAGQQSSYSAQVERQRDLEMENTALERELEYYENEADYIGTDDYVEQEARTRLGWLKPNEVKYMADTDSSAQYASARPAEQSTQAPDDTQAQTTQESTSSGEGAGQEGETSSGSNESPEPTQSTEPSEN